jgi:hypothetical protein
MRKSVKIAGAAAGGIVTLGIIGAVVGGSGSNSPAGPASRPAVAATQYTTFSPDGAQTSNSPGTAAAAPPATTAPPAPAASTAPAMTGSQQQAVDAAQSYLSLGSGFSKQGLIGQLTSSAGNGFQQADAEFAVSYLHPDWNAQAVQAAKGYLALGTGFSRSSLIDQLTSPYGGQFTEAQAEYAVDKTM